MKLTDKDKKGDDKVGSGSGYGDEISTVKFKWTVSQIEALRIEAIERGRSVDYYLRTAASKILEELQNSRDDIRKADIDRRTTRMNDERKHDSMGYVNTVKDAVETVDNGINDLDFCIRRPEDFGVVAKTHYDSLKDFVCFFEDDKVRKILLNKLNCYIDKSIKPDKKLCKLIGLSTDRDCRGRLIKGHKLAKKAKRSNDGKFENGE